MKILVLGATGQLGSNLVRALLEQGDEVRALIRPTSKAWTLEGLPLDRVDGDLNDPESVARACDGVQVVYHAAAYYPPHTVPVSVETNPALAETRNVLDAMRGVSAGHLVFGSTLTTIGFPRKPNTLADETCSFSMPYRNNTFLMGKVAMEDAMLEDIVADHNRYNA